MFSALSILLVAASASLGQGQHWDPCTGEMVPNPVFRADPTQFANGDVNRDGRVDISDPIVLLLHMFADGAPPSPPWVVDSLVAEDYFTASLNCSWGFAMWNSCQSDRDQAAERYEAFYLCASQREGNFYGLHADASAYQAFVIKVRDAGGEFADEAAQILSSPNRAFPDLMTAWDMPSGCSEYPWR